MLFVDDNGTQYEATTGRYNSKLHRDAAPRLQGFQSIGPNGVLQFTRLTTRKNEIGATIVRMRADRTV